METVLYYEPLPLLAPAALAGVLQRRGLRVVRVTRDQAGQSVGHLAGYQGFEAKAGTEAPPQDRVLVFCEVPEATLDAVLVDLKTAGAPPALKAILTGTNASWSFARLARELAREHRTMGG